MEEKQLRTDGFEWIYNRYIGDDPERVASFREELARAGIASKVYAIRKRLRMSREDLAELSGLTVEAIEDLEESDYDGDWDGAIDRINVSFRKWFEEVIVPAAKITPDEYSIKGVGA